MTANVEPVRRAIRVPLDPPRAFDLFTARFGEWWPAGKQIGASPMQRAILEPGVGGRWYERAVDGTECDWGRVLIWEPPTRLVLAWQINAAWQYDPAFVTEVEVRFIAQADGGTRVEVEHRDLDRFGADAGPTRSALDSSEGWPGLLVAYAIRGGASAPSSDPLDEPRPDPR